MRRPTPLPSLRDSGSSRSDPPGSPPTPRKAKKYFTNQFKKANQILDAASSTTQNKEELRKLLQRLQKRLKILMPNSVTFGTHKQKLQDLKRILVQKYPDLLPAPALVPPQSPALPALPAPPVPAQIPAAPATTITPPAQITAPLPAPVPVPVPATITQPAPAPAPVPVPATITQPAPAPAQIPAAPTIRRQQQPEPTIATTVSVPVPLPVPPASPPQPDLALRQTAPVSTIRQPVPTTATTTTTQTTTTGVGGANRSTIYWLLSLLILII